MKYTQLGSSDLKVSRICMGCMGFGDASNGQHSWTIDEAHSREIIKRGLELGVNFFDTAIAYQSGTSEQYLGRALRDFAKRDQVVVATKFLPRTNAEIEAGISGQEHIRRMLDKSLQNLGMDYVDLYLLHQPYGDVAGAWKALEEAKTEGKVRSIGVSNMTPKIWNDFVPQFETLPAVNQVECHPFFQQRELRALLAGDDVKVEAYQPLGHGDASLLSHPAITALAEKYGKNAGQVILRFEVQDGLIVLPKSTNPARIAGNLDLFDFTLTEDDMDTLRALDTGKGHHDPEAPGVAEMLLQNYKIHD